MALGDTPVIVHNERVKLFSGFLNAVGLGLIGFAVLRPLTEKPMDVALGSVWFGLAGLVLHALAHYILGMMRKEARQ
jgi:hypothetical protein